VSIALATVTALSIVSCALATSYILTNSNWLCQMRALIGCVNTR
jgi:hypothetical protein